MKKTFSYVKAYLQSLQPFVFFWCTLFIAVAICCNYYFGLNAAINKLTGLLPFLAWYGIFLSVFFFGYFIQGWRIKLFQNPMFVSLLLIAPALFAWKMAARIDFTFGAGTGQNAYWNHVIYWPLKLVVVAALLWCIWRRCNAEQPFYGTTLKNLDLKPYLLMLLLMVPLIALAATQSDFLAIYPKLKNIAFLSDGATPFHKLLYELSYGSDFVTIELFFRGFLVLAFGKWAGKDAILPMALFYCTIHFGKPVGECISSYFGGLILGAIIWRTKSIWGGLLVHLGIAWLMELAGYLSSKLL